jgi:hypothetical protein
VRRGPGRALRLRVPWGRVQPDEGNEWSTASAPSRARGRNVRRRPPSGKRNARRDRSTTAHGVRLSRCSGNPRHRHATRGWHSEGRGVHRRHHARSVTVRVRPSPYGVLDRDLSVRRSVCRGGIHGRRRLLSRRLRGAGRRCSDRRRCRSRRRCRRRSGWSRRRRSRWGLRRRRRCGCGRWLRGWGGRRHGCRRRVDGGTSRRKQGEWVDVRVAVADAYTEMDVRHGVLGLPGRAGLGDGLTLLDVRTARHLQRAEVSERRLVAVSSRDRDRESVRGHLPCEGDLAAHRRGDRGRVAQCDVDATVLPACVLVVAESEFTQYRPVGRPCPGQGGGGQDQRADDCRATHDSPSRCPSGEHGSTVAPGPRGSNAIDCLVTESRDRGRFWRDR